MKKHFLNLWSKYLVKSITVLSAILFILISNANLVFGQTKNASDFLNFAKQDFTTKSAKLKSSNWSVVKPISTKSENETTTKTGLYEKKISEKKYYIIVEFMHSTKTTMQIEKTSIKLATGNEFDNWVKEFENMGYKFQQIEGDDGFLYSGEKNKFMIKVGIENINDDESEWNYTVTIMVVKK